MSRKARRNELAIVREKRTMLEMEVEQRRLSVAENSVKAVQALESWSPEFVNRADWGISEPGYNLGMGAGSLSQLSDRRDGRDSPFIESTYDVSLARGMARLLSTANSSGVNIRRNLTNYVVGANGYEIKVATTKKREAPAGLIEAAQDVIDEFLDRHNWKGDFDRELFWRLPRDGERFLALYPQRGGKTKARTIEPEQVNDPGRVDESMLARWGIIPPCATSTTFGIHTADHDVETVFGYCFQHQDGFFDYLPAEYVIHSKANVDRNVKRGLTDFYSAWEWLVGEAKLLRNTNAGATAQAAIAWIEQYAAGTTPAAVNQNLDTAADYALNRQKMSGGTRTDSIHEISPGTVRHVSKGKEYLPGPLGAERGSAFLEVSAALLRRIGSIWSFPEYMISGDASNANMASTIEAGTPFSNTVEGYQGGFARFQVNVFWRILKIAFRAGVFDRFGLSWEEIEYALEVLCTPPPIVKPDPLPETQRRQALVDSGVMSKKTWAAEEGLDWDQEQANGATVADQVVAVNSEVKSEESKSKTTAAASDEALNGAQITSLLDIVERVSMGMIPSEAGRLAMTMAFPLVPSSEIDTLIQSLEGFTPAVGVDGKPLPAGAGPTTSNADGKQSAGSQSITSPGGEFGNLSTLQLKRNFKAIDKALDEFIEGKRSEVSTAEYLVSLGLNRERAMVLIKDKKDNGTVEDPEFVAAAQESLARESLPPGMSMLLESAYVAALETATPEDRSQLLAKAWESYP